MDFTTAQNIHIKKPRRYPNDFFEYNPINFEKELFLLRSGRKPLAVWGWMTAKERCEHMATVMTSLNIWRAWPAHIMTSLNIWRAYGHLI